MKRYYKLHDGRIRINTGRDDQRPDHDGVKFFRPICVEQFMGGSDEVWAYVKYCGRCRARMREVEKFCPHCGIGIAHYTFAMGTVEWKPPTWQMTNELPDILPEFVNGQLLLSKNGEPNE